MGVASSGPSMVSAGAEAVRGVKFENLVLTARTGNPTTNANANASFTRVDMYTLQGLRRCRTMQRPTPEAIGTAQRRGGCEVKGRQQNRCARVTEPSRYYRGRVVTASPRCASRSAGSD